MPPTPIVLTFEALMTRSMDSLKLLLLEKNQTIVLLERLVPSDDNKYSELKEEIVLIRKAIRLKEDQSD